MHDTGLLVVCMFAVIVVVVVVLFLRYNGLQLQHRERMAALDKGVPIPAGPPMASFSPRVYYLRGLIWSATGLAIMICLFGLSLSSHRPEPAENRMWRAKSISQSAGIPIDQAQLMVDRDDASHLQGLPASVSLLGLIPLAVGIAYLLFYYSDDSRKTPLSAPAPTHTGLNLN